MHDLATAAIGVAAILLILGYRRRRAKLERANRELEARVQKTQEQLAHAQKLEAVGQLAGGIAHDFNNLLQVINGYAGMASSVLAQGDPIRDFVDQIGQAGERAATLTRQLLAFSRKQVLQPEVVSLNRVVRGIEGMLRQLIGEHIEVVTRLDERLAPVRVDPAQMEQVILNLAINARDAMPRGGTLTLETATVALEDSEFVPSEHGTTVLLSVTDTGSGMDRETLGRIFEPFFTTKPVGQGTGLGLSMVYGVVNQSGGSISVRSEPGKGSAFRIYLPAVGTDAAAPSARQTTKVLKTAGHETVLVVEDSESVRRLVRAILHSAGYEVLEAATPAEALEVAARSRGRLKLVLSDVIMPGMSGPELAARLPEVKFVYMSGYSEQMLAPQGVLRPGVRLIEKPFTSERLTREIRQALKA